MPHIIRQQDVRKESCRNHEFFAFDKISIKVKGSLFHYFPVEDFIKLAMCTVCCELWKYSFRGDNFGSYYGKTIPTEGNFRIKLTYL